MTIWITLLLSLLQMLLTFLLKAKQAGRELTIPERRQVAKVVTEMAAIRHVAMTFDLTTEFLTGGEEPMTAAQEHEAMQSAVMSLTAEERACCESPQAMMAMSWGAILKLVQKFWPIVAAGLAQGKDLGTILLDILAAIQAAPPGPTPVN